MSNNQPLSILFEDNHLLVVNKPAELSTMGALSGPTLHSIAADYLKHKFNKPGKVFVGIVSRLDTVTTGVIVLARTSKAASRMAPQFAGKDSASPKSLGSASKIYLAAIPGQLEKESGTFSDLVYKDDAAHRMRVTEIDRAGAAKATMRYVTLAEGEASSLLAVQLLSGRKHQIRVQLADRGLPIFGDRKYGSRDSFSPGIALHSWKLQITHPTLKERMSFGAGIPKSWQRLPFGNLDLAKQIETDGWAIAQDAFGF